MGREIRRVPPNWVHPKMDHYGREVDQPMFDKEFDAAFADWLSEFDAMRRGEMTDIDRECYPRGLADWLQDNHAPDPAYYRPWKDGEGTWFQVWETVSEGTPVTPPFATPAELVNYLAKYGDFWDQKRGDLPPTREQAEAFVNSGWAPSMVFVPGTGLLNAYESSELAKATE